MMSGEAALNHQSFMTVCLLADSMLCTAHLLGDMYA